jgi:hypothetical protein
MHVSNGRTAVIDSYVFRTIACHEVLGVEMDHAAILAAAIRPDRAVLLTAPEETRRVRLQLRDGDAAEPQWHVRLDDRYEQVLAGYRRFRLKEIETSVPPYRVAELILQSSAAERFIFGSPSRRCQ